MELKRIPHEVCPTCGARTVAESCPSIHCNGQGFENRIFACGAEWKWSPNFEHLDNPVACPKSPAEIARKKAADVVNDKLIDFLLTLDAPEEWKQRLFDFGAGYELSKLYKHRKQQLDWENLRAKQ